MTARQVILKVLMHGEPMHIRDIQEATAAYGIRETATGSALFKSCDRGEIQKTGYGVYRRTPRPVAIFNLPCRITRTMFLEKRWGA